LDDATMTPEGWADAPDGSTLCGVSSTLDDSVQVIDYVTDLSGDDVLAHYEDALGDGFEVERTDGSLGQPALAGTDPTGASFEIEPGEATFTITFAVA
ncbi:MAG TPA: hypothetical protein VHK88_18045, partial [Aquihabitans sp.]|nr:hypothetical protein [Aquihabitans sp.]